MTDAEEPQEPEEEKANDAAETGSEEQADELLSQEEIDTLLSGVDEGEVATESSVVDGEAVAFDFTRQDRIVRGRMPTLEMVNERFARFFRPSLLGLMQRGAEVTPQGIRVEKYSDYAASLPMPASLSWIELKPLHGAGLLMLDATLVFHPGR